MTHDELLDYLREHEEYWTSLRANRWAKVPAFNALRAVVELHKPKATIRGYRCKFDDEKFPCTHHQVIEKELA